MPSTTPNSAANSGVLSSLEQGKFRFQIKTGNAKWDCTIMDRATHEKRKAAAITPVSRTNSMTSLESTSSTESK